VSALPVVLVGAGQRVQGTWGPLLRGALSDRLTPVGVIGRTESRARETADGLGLPWSLDLDAATGWGARAAVVAVSSPENAVVAGRVLDLGLPALLETPLALDLDAARALRDRARDLPVAVAEQNPNHLGSRLIIATCRAGVIGEPLVIATEGAGYRYHGLAVARAVLGRPRGRIATGQRVVRDDVDAGRGMAEEILVGTVRAEGGGLVQFRDAEAAWVADGPWSRGGGRVLGTRGEFVGGSVVQWSGSVGDGARTALPVEPVETAGANPRRIGLRLMSDPPVQVTAALPEHDLSDDAQAVAACALGWLAQLDRRATDGAWSVHDAYADLAWVEGISRSAVLGGAPITLDA